MVVLKAPLFSLYLNMLLQFSPFFPNGKETIFGRSGGTFMFSLYLNMLLQFLPFFQIVIL